MGKVANLVSQDCLACVEHQSKPDQVIVRLEPLDPDHLDAGICPQARHTDADSVKCPDDDNGIVSSRCRFFHGGRGGVGRCGHDNVKGASRNKGMRISGLVVKSSHYRVWLVNGNRE